MNPAELLRSADLRVTQTRLDVIGIFTKHDFAIGNNTIEDALPEVDRITVYRTLKTFEESGIIHKVLDSAGSMKYALCEEVCLSHDHHHDHHVHFHCDNCDNTYCIDEVSVPDIKLPGGYVIKDKSLIITGTCENCAEK